MGNSPEMVMRKFKIVSEIWSKYGYKEKERVVKEFEAVTFEEAQKVFRAFERKYPLRSYQYYVLSERVR